LKRRGLNKNEIDHRLETVSQENGFSKWFSDQLTKAEKHSKSIP
jgi:hypothetical protein